MDWIDLKDSQPDDFQYVIVGRMKSRDSMEACFPAMYADDKFWVPTLSGQKDMVNPTHWMPLPEPPRS